MYSFNLLYFYQIIFSVFPYIFLLRSVTSSFIREDNYLVFISRIVQRQQSYIFSVLSSKSSRDSFEAPYVLLRHSPVQISIIKLARRLLTRYRLLVGVARNIDNSSPTDRLRTPCGNMHSTRRND